MSITTLAYYAATGVSYLVAVLILGVILSWGISAVVDGVKYVVRWFQARREQREAKAQQDRQEFIDRCLRIICVPTPDCAGCKHYTVGVCRIPDMEKCPWLDSLVFHAEQVVDKSAVGADHG